MKNYSYLEKVLSHIKGKRNKETVRLELFDHIDERNKYYEQIGFDEEAACDKAEYAMGDGDIVGEQLDLQLRSKWKMRFLYLLLDFAAIAASLCVYEFDSTTNFADYIAFSDFLLFVLSFAALMLCVFCLVLATRRKHLTSIFVGSIFSFYPIIKISVGINSSLYSFLQGSSVALPFYDYLNVDNDIVLALSIVLIILFSLIIAAAFFNCIVVFIKTKRLENTRYDLKQRNIIIIVLKVTAAVVAALTVVISVNVIAYRDKAFNAKTEISCKVANSIVNNVESFMTDDKDEILSAIDDAFDEGECNTDHINCESFDFDKIYPADADYDETSGTLVITTYQHLENPFATHGDDYYTEYRYTLTADDVFKNMTINDAPLPANVEFMYSRKGCSIRFDYAEDNSYILFTYNFDKKCFELADSSELSYGKSLSLSPKQKKMFDEAVRNYVSIDMKICTLIYNVSCAEKCSADNIYKVDFGYCFYYAEMDGGELKFSEKNLEEEITALVEINDNSVEIISLLNISTQYDKGDEYLRRFFTEKGYENYISRNTKWYNDALKES